MSDSNYYKKENDQMAETLKNIESNQKDQNVYIPPKFRVKDPIAPASLHDHPMFTPTSRDYGMNPVTKETQVIRFPKSNTFSSGLVGRNYTDNSLNTSSDKKTFPYSSSSLSF